MTRFARGRPWSCAGIVSAGDTGQVAVPPDALVVDGSGQYLLPGLTDAHVHLETGLAWAPARDNFGDGPIYLSYGVTTVVNLAGGPDQLEWRRRIETGELVGPTIYTSGPFVNEPRVTTPEEVERDIVSQAERGFDLIKFHELANTTVGLSAASYRRMIETARRIGIPLVGHAPVHLGLDELLTARQDVAHVGMFVNAHFLPLTANIRIVLATGIAALILIVMAAIAVIEMFVRRLSKVVVAGDPANRLARKLSATTGLAAIAAFIVAAAFLPGGPLFDSTALRVLFTALAAVVVTTSALAVAQVVFRTRGTRVSAFGRIHALVGGASSAVLAYALVMFWVPLAWRSSDAGIDALAKRARAAGISVQSTLVVYESLTADRRAALVDDPVVEVLSRPTRDVWRQLVAANTGLPLLRLVGFQEKVIAALHREGVPIAAGTDAMGMELIAPGSALHNELRLLFRSGLSTYDVLRSATVVPAAFLGKSKEFGTIAPGQRADLLLVGNNPLQDLAVLRQPDGVMARGRWHTRHALDSLLAGLAKD